MKIDVMKPLLDWEKKPLPEQQPDGSERILTLRDVVMNAFLAPQKGDEQQTAADKVKDYDTFLKFANATSEAPEVDLDPSEAIRVRDRVGRGWLLRVSGPAMLLLRG